MKLPRLSPIHAIGVLIAWALKSFYSRAGADDVWWILAPTCRLAGLLSGIDFVPETGSGWISHSHRMIIGAGCSGVNFLIIAFLTLLFLSVSRVRSPAARGLCLAGSLAGAWILTTMTNATRIVLALALHDTELYGGVLTPARVHLAAGTVVYCLSLVLVYHAVDKVFRGFRNGDRVQPAPSALVPLGWYLAVTTGIPLVNRAWRDNPSLFLEHTVFVISVCAVILLALFMRGRLSRAGRMQGGAPPRC